MSGNPLIDFGRRVRALRNRNSLTLDELSFYLGIKPETLEKIENGEKTPDLITLNLLSTTLGVSFDYLITGKEKEDRSSYNALSKKVASTIKAFEELVDEYYCSSSGSFIDNCCVSAIIALYKDKVNEKRLIAMIFVGLSLAKYGQYPLVNPRVSLPIKKEDSNEELFDIAAFIFGCLVFYKFENDEITELFTSFLVAQMSFFEESNQGSLLGYILPKESSVKTSKSIILKARTSKENDVTRKYLQAIINQAKKIVDNVSYLQENLIEGYADTGYLSIGKTK